MHLPAMEEPERHLAPQLVPPLLVAGLVTMVALTNGDAWPLSLVWAGVGALFALFWRRLRARRSRLVVGIVSAVTLVVLTWEGGLFVLPGLLAALVFTWVGRP